MRKLILIFSLLAMPVMGAAQVSISASSVTDSFQHSTTLSRLCFTPVDATMTPQGFRYGTTQVLPTETCGTVTLGVLQSGLTVAPNPTGINYHVYVKASNSNTILRDFGMVHITGSSWTLDTYDPNMAILPVSTIQAGTFTTAPAGTGASCTITGSGAGPFLLNCSVPQGVAGPGGSNTPGGTDLSTLAGTDFGAKLNACVGLQSGTYGGICEGRALSYGALATSSALTINTPNTVVYLPCATITTAQQIIVPAGVRNVTFHGCGFQGGSAASGTAGGTVWVYTGSGPAFKVGDPTYAVDTKGFHMDNVNVNTANAGTAAGAFAFYRTQEIDLRNLYLNGNQLTGQTGILLDGTGNYSGGTFDSDTMNGYGAGVYMTGHLTGSAIGDYANASTFTRLHIACPTSSGNPITGTFGINIVAGDGNTWAGGDVEGCDTMFHLGANAVNNTVDGLRNENSNTQYLADSGSSYNKVVTGGTFYTGRLVDNGSRNSFEDAFHFAHNGMKGDWYASQQDATVVNHLRLGIGTGTVRGLQWETQVDQGTSGSQYNWLWGLTDGASGQSNWIYQDLINNVIRLQFQQYNTAGGSNPTAINGAGTGNVCVNCSANSGTGGFAVASGGATPTAVASIDGSGNTTLAGALNLMGVFTAYSNVKAMNAQDAEIDYILQAGLTTSQKESLVYKDWNGASQWYALKDQNNNWALNSALSGLDSFKAYQSTNSGDTYINAQSPTGVVRINYETGSGTGVKIYGGASNLLYASFLGSTSIQFPGLAASSGSNCLQIDNSGYLTNTGHACGSGNGNGNGSVTSVVLTVPADESVSGSPITGSGTFGITRNNQAANLFLAGPCSGGSTTPVYRALCANDFPSALFDTYGAAAAAQTASLQKSNNLSDVGNAATARTNLGLGTAATQNTTAFDAAGAAASAQAASVPTTTTVNGHPLSGNVNVTAADAGAVTKTNTLGCLDGYDHLPCTVYEMGLTSESAATGSYATAYTTPAAGVYRITGNVYATTVSTTSYTVTMLVKEGQTGSVTSHGMGVVSAAIGTSESWNNGTLVTQNLNSGVAITWETSGSGTNTSGVWNVDLVIERVK